MAETPVRAASVADFTFKVGEKSTEDLKVTGFSGIEGISRLFEYRIDLCSDAPDIAFADVVGKPCVLEINAPSGSRFVNGIVRRFERTGEGSSLTYYSAEVVPAHWLLTLRHKSRIFQETNCSDMTIPGIIRKVLEDAGIPSDNFRFALQGSYDTREYVVQYRESEMNFIARLMEDEGIFYFFEHAADKHVMVFGDSPVAHTDNPNSAEFAYREKTGLVSEHEQEYIHSLRDSQGIHVGAITLDDYNFEQPQVDLKAQASGDQYTSLEYSDYPGFYNEKSVGDRYATVRLEEFQCRKRVQQMRATIRALLTGYKFTLIEHPTAALNQEYLVTDLRLLARQPQSGQEETGGVQGIEFESEIRTIPADVPFRPPRVTTKPRIHGTQTAVVVGPSGEEIYTDEYGRVKLQYFWDREGEYNENSSRWTRVSQGSAGGQYGSMFLPRIGQEVIVEYLEGDPDRPIVTGRVYNNDLMPPYALPDEKTKSCIKTHSSKGGGGTNEIRFEDKKDSEEIYMHAEKDTLTEIENNRTVTLKEAKADAGHDVLTVEKGNRTVTLNTGNLSTTLKKGNLTTTLDEGNETHELKKGNRTIKVKGNQEVTVDGNYTLTVKGDLSITVTGDISITGKKSITTKATKDITEKASGNATFQSGTAMTVKGGTTTDVKAGTNLTAKAGANATLQGGANTEVKGGAQTKVSGPMVDVNGSAMVKIAGGMVKVG